MYPNPQIEALISRNFVPVRVHVREQAQEFKRLGEQFGAQWTPTILMLDPSGHERHRVEGFLPAADFLAQLEFGLARIDFATGNFQQAEQRFRNIVDEQASSDVAPEALYWAGVSQYKATNDAKALQQTAAAFQKQYQDTPWAKKASVWRRAEHV